MTKTITLAIGMTALASGAALAGETPATPVPSSPVITAPAPGQAGAGSVIIVNVSPVTGQLVFDLGGTPPAPVDDGGGPGNLLDD